MHTTKVHLITDASGNPTQIKLSPGNTHDVNLAFDFLEELPKQAKNFLADRGYDSNLLRICLKSINITPVIPGKKNRKEQIEYDKEKYKARHVVENAFCRLKEFRSIATRYEKLSRNYLSMIYLGCIVIWTQL